MIKAHVPMNLQISGEIWLVAKKGMSPEQARKVLERAGNKIVRAEHPNYLVAKWQG